MSDRYGYQWTEHKPDVVMAGWFGGKWIPIDHISAHVGGSWQLRDDAGNPLCYDAPLVQFFYNKVHQVDNPIVVDIGASTGNFTLLPTVYPMTVYAFEPNPVAFRALQSNVIISGLTNKVRLYQTALSNHTTTTTLKVPVIALHAAIACLGNGNPRPRGFEWNEIDVGVARLDDYHLAPDFIKIDVEGAELSVLQGAERTIKQHHPGILTEYTSLNTKQFGYEREEIIKLLRDWGYK
jgi:FkbM family methyltransferase